MKKSSLLINEPPLQVLPSLAKAIGLNEAIITQQLHYWLENPKAGVERNGFKWIFNTYDEWQENFPFWSVSTIQRIFISLEGKKIVISAQLDAKSRDMRKYYRLDYDYLDTLQDINLTSSNASHWDDVKGNTETTTENISPKGDLVDAMLLYEQKPASIRQAIKEYFKLNVNWETKTARQWMEWAVGENITPDQLARAADLWRKDKQFNWQVPSLKGIFEKWPMLTASNVVVPQTQCRSERLERSL